MMETYLDYAATAPLLPEARAAMIATLDQLSRGEFGNASALHSPGQRAKAALEDARAEVARLIDADPDEIIFTSGGSEANNTVANTFAGQLVAASAIEHPSVLDSLKTRARELHIINVDRRGFVDPSDIPTSVNLVSIMLANNELGTIEPTAEIAKRLAEKKPYEKSNPASNHANATYLHSDATQALGKIPVSVKDLGVDYLTISAHKIGGPVGIGALFVKKGAPFRPLIIGGHQESKRRAGTSNVLAAVGFAAAAKFCHEHDTPKQYARIATLRDQLAARILRDVPYAHLNTPLDRALPNILNVSFAAAEGESIQLYLDAAGISVSTGSACAAGDLQPSHVLMATAHDAETAHSSLRISLGLNTTPADLDHVMSVLPDIIKHLQGISTIKIQEIKEDHA